MSRKRGFAATAKEKSRKEANEVSPPAGDYVVGDTPTIFAGSALQNPGSAVAPASARQNATLSGLKGFFGNFPKLPFDFR